MILCAVCRYLRLAPCEASGSVGLLTSIPELIFEATDQLESSDPNQPHIMLAVCAQHVVDIYRGRVAGVRMAWRLAPEPVPLAR